MQALETAFRTEAEDGWPVALQLTEEQKQVLLQELGLAASGRVCDSQPYQDPKKVYQAAEALPAYKIEEKKPGEFTLEDYYALPDDQRVELIDGTFFVMEAPGTLHQGLSAEIYGQLRDHIRDKKGSCLPLYAPIDVQLDCDNRTMVEPDVLVLCDRSKLIRRCIYGAPDLVMEILSPSTRKKDCSLKLHKYCNAGVREYWIIYPEEKKVVVYDFENDAPPRIYGFDAKIPVGIFHGDCVIDFQEICDSIGFLFDLPEGPEEQG
ncbi:MAG: Uma2 family endonuclease [Lachnospiraceae bacterium]|nr:Uma2 family endonuclease [Lachnospiraceae bacterium]